MKEILYSSFVIIASIYLLGCNRGVSGEAKNEGVLTINIDTISESFESVDIDKIRYIPLETSDSSIISSIGKVIFFNNLFYISDFWDSKALFIFSDEGKFVKKINSFGRGPGEYLQPVDFDIDPQGKIRILDVGLKKVLTFSTYGDYIKEEKLDIRFMEFFWTGDDNFLFNSQYDIENGDCLGLYDLSSKKINTLISSRGIRDNVSIKRLSTHYFFKSNNTVLFLPRFSNICYQLSQNDYELKKRMTITSDHFPDEAFLEEFRTNPQLGDIYPEKILDITNIYETSEFLYLRIGYGRYMRHNILYSKNSGNFTKYQRIDKEKYLGDESIHGIAKDLYISILPANKKNHIPNWNKSVNELMIDDYTKSLLCDFTIESNPIIVLFSFKLF